MLLVVFKEFELVWILFPFLYYKCELGIKVNFSKDLKWIQHPPLSPPSATPVGEDRTWMENQFFIDSPAKINCVLNLSDLCLQW